MYLKKFMSFIWHTRKPPSCPSTFQVKARLKILLPEKSYSFLKPHDFTLTNAFFRYFQWLIIYCKQRGLSTRGVRYRMMTCIEMDMFCFHHHHHPYHHRISFIKMLFQGAVQKSCNKITLDYKYSY